MAVNTWLQHVGVKRAAGVIAAGGVVAYPTEAVWGLGADPNNPAAVARLLHLKHRSPRKGLILIASHSRQLAPWLDPLSEAERERLAQSWPGPVTWLVPNRGLASHWITGDFSTLALRVTNHPLAAALCQHFGGPIVSTSANPQGRPPARDRVAARRYFGGRLDDVLPGQVGDRAKPSEIRDLATGQIIRGG